MQEADLVNLLVAQAEALVSNTDERQWLSDYEPRKLQAARPFMEVARLLRRLLVPVPTPPAFRLQLRNELLSGAASSPRARKTVAISAPRRPRVWLGAAAVGSILSLAGLLFFWRRRGCPLPAGDLLEFSS